MSERCSLPPRWRLADAIQHLSRSRHDQPTGMALPVGRVHRRGIEVTQVDALAALPRNAGGECHLYPRRFEAARRVEGAQAADVRRVREDSARVLLELLPLREEVVAAVIA